MDRPRIRQSFKQRKLLLAAGGLFLLSGVAFAIAKLEPGVIRIHRAPEDGGTVARMAVGGGFAQVLENTVTLLVTDAVVAEDVDAAQVKKQLADVVERLSHPASDEDARGLRRLRRALQARLSLVE